MHKLNLGSGNNYLDCYVNVDLNSNSDLQLDLESTPWPWSDSTIDEVVLRHVLEHLGETRDIYFNIIKELHRVCIDGALIKITVPHPRHDDFINDPTHVRAITPDGLRLFSKKLNKFWAENNYANTPLAFILNVDFDISRVKYIYDSFWSSKIDSGEISQNEIRVAQKMHNNVIREVEIDLIVNKQLE